jgi:hypothetical protein
MVLEEPAAEITSKVDETTAALRASTVPYLHIAGADLDPAYRQWLGTHLPAATVEVWHGTGPVDRVDDTPRFSCGHSLNAGILVAT